MADIVDTQVIRFINESVRPMAERMRAMKAVCDSALVTWYGQISADCPNDSSPIADGREAEGVSRLTGADVNNLVTQMAAFKTACEVSGVADVISKPCVQVLSV